MKTAELSGAQLDWAVAKGMEKDTYAGYWTGAVERGNFTPSTNWLHGGPIIERECISLCPPWSSEPDDVWTAWSCESQEVTGPTALVAAMRAYVSEAIGDEIEIPEELWKPNLVDFEMGETL